MKFDITPYYDDFDESQDYYRVLFRPGVSVQTREMNYVQSMLQNQIAKVGDHLFKNGSMVIPGQVNYNAKLNYLKIASTNLGDTALADLESENIFLSSKTDGTGVVAQVIKAFDATAAGDPITLVVLYTSSDETVDLTLTDKIFPAGSTIYLRDDPSKFMVAQTTDHNGRSVVAGIQKGVYYYNGHFVSVAETSVALQTYVSDIATVSAKVGIQFVESIVTPDGVYVNPITSTTTVGLANLAFVEGGDQSLYDNAIGTPNYAAPGAHRYKITPDFIVAGIDENPPNFFELLRVEEGVLQELVNASQYNILEETLARRTYDESGNYVLDDFKFDVREHRTNNRGAWLANQAYQVKDYVVSNVSSATTRYFECIQAGVSDVSEPALLSAAGVDETTVITDSSVKWRYIKNAVSNRGKKLTGDSSNLVATFGFGKAYVQGYEISKTSNTDLIIPKARETRTENNRNIALPQGNYVYLDKKYTYGIPDVSTQPPVLLYDRFAQSNILKFGYGNLVGTARINWVENDARGGLKVSLNNIKMLSGKGFDRDVNRIVIADATTSNVTQTSYTLTGTIKYAGNTTSSFLVLGGTLNNASTSVGGNVQTIVTGTTTAFASELVPGDVIAVGASSSFATISSWTVVSIQSQTQMTVFGPAFATAAASTSVYARFAAQTVFGHQVGAATPTRFQSEYRVGDQIFLGLATSGTTGTVLAIQSESRMTVSSTQNTLLAATSHGTYYTGRTATFAGDIWSNFANGINARKYTGLYTLSDYSGGATTVTTHNAIRITGSNDAKMLAEFATNDYCDINGNRIFITKVSSNTVAFGVCLDGSITGSTAQYPAFRVNANLQETSSSSLLFPIVNYNAVSSIVDNIYTVYKTQSVSVVQSGTTCVVTLAPASGNAGAEQGSLDPTAYFVSTDGSASPTTSYAITNVSILGNNITLTTNGSWAANTIRVIYPVTRTANNSNVLGNVKSKTLTFNQTDYFLSSSTAVRSTLQLSKTDVYKIVKVFMATSFVGAWSATIQNAATDVTSRYDLDSGQRDSYYDVGQLILKSGFPAPTGSIAVYYDYFEHGAGDFFARASYNPQVVPYENIPQYNRQNLANLLDFRASVNTSTGLVANAAPPRFNSFFNADVSYYLGRKEMIFLDRSGAFYNVAGASDINPQLPKVTANNNAVNLYNLGLTPYTQTSEFPDVTTQRIDNRRYTMRDIGRIEKRVTNLEETTTLSLLESKAASLQIRDNLDNTLERYKTGFFVDSFRDYSNAEVNIDSRFSIDPLANTMQVPINAESFPLVEKTNFTASIYTSSELVSIATARKVDNYKVTGGLMTIDFTTSTMLQQSIATTSIAVAPFLTATFLGHLTIRPDQDIYENITTVNKIVSESSNLTAAALAKAVADLRTWWGRPYRVDTEVVNVYQGSDRTATYIPFARANSILLKAVGMKPNSKFYTFFEDLGVEGFLSGAVKLTFDAVPFLDVDNFRASANSEWPRWRQLYRSLDVEEVTRAYQVRTGRRSWAWAYEYGWFHRTFKPLDFENNLPSSATRDAFRLAFGAGPVVYYYEGSTCVGSGVIAHQDANTCYLVNARGKLASNYIRSNGSVNYSSGRFYISTTNSEVRRVYATATVANALTQDSNGNLYSDSKGVIVGVFDLPDTDTHKFLAGKIPVVVTDSSTNNPDTWTSRAQALYTVQGFDVLITNNYSATQNYVLRPYDPIAQSFMIPSQHANGVFITDIDVFFQAKPLVEKTSVSLELRTCDSTGRPSAEEMVPGTAVTLYPDDITVDANTGQTPTKFTFKQPIYLTPGKTYAFVLRADTKNYRVWMATLGQQDKFDANKTYSTQATFGSLFKSQDGTLWTEDQLSDIKFNINRAVFKTADTIPSGATAQFVNHRLENAQLPNSPFTFTHGSNKIRVGHKNHGFASGDTTRFFSAYWQSQYALNNTTAINGIPVGEIFGSYVSGSSTSYRPADSDPRQYISDVTLDTYTITVSSVANLGAAATTGITQATAGGEDVFGQYNVLYHIVKPNARVLTFQPTTLSLNARMLKGFTYDTDSQITPAPYNWITKSLNFNNQNILDTSCIVLTDTNSYDRVATSLLITAGGASQIWTDSFIATINMNTTDDAVSPAVDIGTFYMDTVQHRIDNPSLGVRLGNVLPAIGSTSVILVIDTICSGNTTVSFDGNLRQINSTQEGLFNNVIPGRYINVSGSTVVGNTYTSTALLVTAVRNDGRQVTVSGTLATAQAGDAIWIRQYNDFTEEYTFTNASNEAKYITNIINLKNPASQLKMIIEACVPSAADFDVYYKTGAAGADFTTATWTRFVAPLQTNPTSSYATIAKSDQRGVYTDVTFNISNFDTLGNPVDITPFTAFQIKIVMRTSNAARVPQFRNLRVIAHA